MIGTVEFAAIEFHPRSAIAGFDHIKGEAVVGHLSCQVNDLIGQIHISGVIAAILPDIDLHLLSSPVLRSLPRVKRQGVTPALCQRNPPLIELRMPPLRSGGRYGDHIVTIHHAAGCRRAPLTEKPVGCAGGKVSILYQFITDCMSG